jgi:ribosomal protein S25
MTSKEDILKMMEDMNDKNEFEEFSYEFNIDEIKEAINKVIDELNPNLISVFDVSIFLGKVAKKLTETFYNSDMDMGNKYTVITSIANSVLDELELKGLITLDLSIQFREIFKESAEYKDVINNVSNFMKADAEQKQMILTKSFQTIISKFIT